MKKIIGLVAATLVLSACGSNEESKSNTQTSQELLSFETFFVDELIVTPTNGGINPASSAYKVEGRIMVGANRCEASGVDAVIDQSRVGEKIHLIAKTLRPAMQHPRVCTREFAPVYKNVAITILGDSNRMSNVIAKNVRQMGQDRILSEYLITESETILHDLKVEVLPATDKSGTTTYNIYGTVLLGSNECFASGSTAKFRVETIGNTILVTPMIE